LNEQEIDDVQGGENWTDDGESEDYFDSLMNNIDDYR